MLKESAYNYYLFRGQDALVYNSLNGAIGKITDKSRFQSILDNVRNKNELIKDAMFENLAEDKYFVDNNYDESLMGNLRYNEYIYGSGLNMTILASEQCNFRCKYCYEDYKRGNITQEVIDSFILFLRKNLRDYSKLSIDWFGGEPLLAAKEIETISKTAIDLCQKTGKPFSASMTTNGYMLTADMLKKMLKYKILSYQITIDGLAETHNTTRPLYGGGPTFEKIIDNLREIRDTVASRFFKILIRTNVTKPQLAKINDYTAFLSREFGNDRRFEFFFRPAGNWGGETAQTIEKDFVLSQNEYYELLLNNAESLNTDAYIMLLNTMVCGAAKRNSFVLGSDGTIYKCTMLFNEDFNNLGRLTHDGNMKIDTYKLARWTAIPAILPEKCNNCIHWVLCHDYTCPAHSIKGERQKNKNCGYERTSIDHVLTLLDKCNSRYIKVYQ